MGHFKGERTSRLPHFKLEGWFQSLAVKQHICIGSIGKFISQRLQVGVVRGNHPKCPALVEGFKEGLGQGPTELRVAPCPEFINEQQRIFTALSQEPVHVFKPVGIGAQVILD